MDEFPAPVPNDWPLPNFRFKVQLGDAVMICQEVSGLDSEAQSIEFRRGASPKFAALENSNTSKSTKMTLKNGVIEGMSWDWLNQIMMSPDQRMPVTIYLLSEAGNPTMIWSLANARPTKIAGADLTGGGQQVAVDTIELAHEGLTITNPV